jgi:hypothetical protein
MLLMQALWLEVPEKFLEERWRLGHDKKDELWDGVLHLVPLPGSRHQRLTSDLTISHVSIVLGVRLETVGALLRIHDGDSFTDV